ncbi:family S53 protease-like protein [Mycena galericulata]|nr:family S53 protease-like protein [Mycena galericulata]
MTFRTLLAVLSIVAAASAATMVIHERAAVPNGFTSRGPAPADDMLTLRVALASNNAAGLQERLASLAAPGSSEFRQWLTMDEVKSFVQPSAETVSAFNAFASANDLTPTVISPNRDWVSITLPVSQANTLFGAQFEVFSHPALNNTITRTLSVSLPSELVGHVNVLHPTTAFAEPNPRLVPRSSVQLNDNKRTTPAAPCNTSEPDHGVITPTCLQELYGIPATPATQSTNALLVTAYEQEYALQSDLTIFLEQFRPDIPSNTTFTLLSVDGGVNPQTPFGDGLEANLDVQYTTGIATEVLIQFLSVGVDEDDFLTGLLDTTTFLDGVASPPTVMTTSYGATESTVGISMATKICDGYMALGSRGISVVFASGDGGVRGNHDSTSVCGDNVFMPVFPAACPFVTAVGSTQGFGPEKAANFSGGGFSNYFPSPYYQAAAVNGFIESLPGSFGGTFNKTGRGYPDVSLQGLYFEMVGGGETGTLSGTSASSPTFASIIALINDQLIAAGKPILGFLNPWIYSTASTAFTDITIGHNAGFVCPAFLVAFNATVGWDPLTGFGTPIFSELLAAAMA